MTYRTILLHVDALPPCKHRVDAALDLARRFDARVIGLATRGQFVLPIGFDMAPSGEFIAEWQDYLEAMTRDAAAAFEAAAQKRGIAAVETRFSDLPMVDAVDVNARYADLVVVGQEDPADKGSDGFPMAPGDMVMRCSRPVLVVPYVGAPSGFGSNILVAWNGSREASRAVADALPLLKRARRVTVMAVNPQVGSVAHGPLPGADLAAYLAHHGVKVEVEADSTPITDVGEELLSRIADLEADMLVMGAYGHSRAREWIFGGATRTILASMTVPVLMSH